MLHTEYVVMGEVHVWNPLKQDNEATSVAIEVINEWDYLVLSPYNARSIAKALITAAHEVDGGALDVHCT